MTRRDDIRILPSSALTVTLIALVTFVVQYHRAAMWACVVALVIAVAALFTVAIEAGREKDRADDAERLACDLAEKLGAAEVERDIAADLLAQREADARRAGIRAVPAQRDGSEYEWPAIMRAVEGETGGAV